MVGRYEVPPRPPPPHDILQFVTHFSSDNGHIQIASEHMKVITGSVSTPGGGVATQLQQHAPRLQQGHQGGPLL